MITIYTTTQLNQSSHRYLLAKGEERAVWMTVLGHNAPPPPPPTRDLGLPETKGGK